MQLVFFGEVLAGFEPDAVRQKLGDVFKLEGARLAEVLSGKRVVINRSVADADAPLHVARFAKLGARVHIEPVAVAVADAAALPKAAAGAATGDDVAPASGTSAASDVPPTAEPAVPGRKARLPIVAAGVIGLAGVLLLVAWLWPWPRDKRDAPADEPTPAELVRGAPAAAQAAAAQAAAASAAATELARLPTAEAQAAFQNEYSPATGHKAFAVSMPGAWGWKSGAASADEAMEAAVASCEARRKPDAPECEPVNVDGEWGSMQAE